MSTVGPASTSSSPSPILAALAAQRRGQALAPVSTQAAEASRSDTVELSGEAPETESLVFVRASQQPDRAARVQALKAAIAAGTYDVESKLGTNLDIIADRLLRDLNKAD